jgi:uncharacterized protein (TIGR02145 family)
VIGLIFAVHLYIILYLETKLIKIKEIFNTGVYRTCMEKTISNLFLILIILTAFLSHSCEKKEVPVVSTAEVTNLTGSTAISGGTIIDDGGSTIIASGVCWNTQTDPTINNNITSNDAGAGSFVSKMTGLEGSTEYYVRAYATNKAGTGYGEEKIFMTTPRNIVFNQSVTYGSLTDQEGNIYKTVKIGEQIWMAENLRTTHYQDGSFIPNVTVTNEWTGLNNAAYCFYNNDTLFKNIYGALYNWYAVADQRKVCPDGWHIPSDAEWTLLETSLGGAGLAGMKLREVGFMHWVSPNVAANNQSGFTALPGGSRYWNFKEDFLGIGHYGYWWSSTEDISNDEAAWYRSMDTNSAAIERYYHVKRVGFSVRCVKD